MLDFDDFCARLACELELTPDSMRSNTSLIDDLKFDSLLTFELVLLIEELISGMIPEELIGQLVTLEDVFSLYRTRATQN